MKEEDMSWFHCGKCGSLFMSRMGETVDRKCGECGRSPSVAMGIAAKQDAIPERIMPVPSAEFSPANPLRREGKRRGKWKMTFQILLAWIIFMGCIVGAAKLLWPNVTDSKAVIPEKVETNEEMTDRRVIASNIQTVTNSFQAFLGATSPEEKNQFVDDPIEMAGKMARFYELNPRPGLNIKSMQNTGNAILHVPGGDVMETRWQSNDGRIYQAFFKKKDAEWRLDWEDFERYSTYPWALFLHEDGEAVGEFRLLARERLAKEMRETGNISVVLYAPKQGRPEEIGNQSPEFRVKLDSRTGRLLVKAFDMAASGQAPFASPLPNPDPEGLIRIRARIHRSGQGKERIFVIENIFACHWMSVEAPGVDMDGE